MTDVADLRTIFSADSSGLDKALSGGLKGIADFSKKAGDNLQELGGAFAKMAAPLAAGFGAAIYSAMNFETQMANIGAILMKDQDEMAEISAQILEMGSKSVAGPQAVADAFAEIAGGVADSSTHMAILDAAIKTSEAGMADMQSTTAAMVSIMNAYGFSASQAGYVSDILTQSVGMGVGSMEEFAAAFPIVTGLASTMGIQFEDVAAAIALMTTKGFTASTSATKLQAAMTALLNPNETMTKAFKELGVVNGQMLVDMYGLTGALEVLTDTSIAGEKGLAKMLGSTEALQAALVLTGDGAEEFRNQFTGALTESEQAMYDMILAGGGLAAAQAYLDGLGKGFEGVTDAAREIQMQSTSAQFALLKSEIQGLAIEIGVELLPILKDIMVAAKPIIKTVINWTRENKPLVKQIAMVTAGALALGGALTIAGSALSIASTLIGAVGAALGFLLSPLGLVIAAIVGIGVAYKTNFLGFADAVHSVVDAFKSGGLEAAINAFFDVLKNAGMDAFKWVTDKLVTPILSAIKTVNWNETANTLLETLKNALEDGATAAWDGLEWLYKNVLTPLVEAAKAVDWNEVINTLFEAWKTAWTFQLNAIWDALGWIKSNIIEPLAKAAVEADWGQIANDAWELLKGAFNSVISWDAGEWVTTNILTPIIDAIRGMLESIVTAASAIGSSIIAGIGGGIAAGMSALEGIIKGAINKIIPDRIGFDIPSVDLGALGTVGGGSVGVDLPDPFPGYARGTSWTGSGGIMKPAGFVHNQEAVVPHNGMRVIPSPNGLLLEGANGGGGRTFNIGNVNFYGVQNPEQLKKALDDLANRSAQPTSQTYPIARR